MRLQSVLMASAIAMVLMAPAIAQPSRDVHRYGGMFKYSDQAIKALTENPQDRTGPVSKLAETLGGKLESLYFLPMGGEFDGLFIEQLPNDAALEAANLIVRSSGNFARYQAFPLMGADEFKALLERAKQGSAAYSAPTATRQ